jgi:hypothetical protein
MEGGVGRTEVQGWAKGKKNVRIYLKIKLKSK